MILQHSIDGTDSIETVSSMPRVIFAILLRWLDKIPTEISKVVDLL